MPADVGGHGLGDAVAHRVRAAAHRVRVAEWENRRGAADARIRWAGEFAQVGNSP
ncbi:hypothetical protein [Streptomyces malaysiensis]|uniref:hypothetical protein n=1 Tax=Streptomyces malaysiensis TaxID=92644 RepID=UPI002B2A40D8|nr:hypothetical protein R8789_41350 [Streptomyces malaysiensis]